VQKTAPRNPVLVVAVFLLVGPLLWMLPSFLHSAVTGSFATPTVADVLLAPGVILFGAGAWWLLGIRTGFWALTIAPTALAGFLAWGALLLTTRHLGFLFEAPLKRAAACSVVCAVSSAAALALILPFPKASQPYLRMCLWSVL